MSRPVAVGAARLRRSRWEAAWLLAASLCAAGAALGCGGEPDPPAGGEDLFTGDLLPDLLVEEESLALPPALGGNRFLTGWRPDESGGQPAVRLAAEGGRLEVVLLGSHPRTLALDLDLDPERPEGETVRVRVAGREAATIPLADPLKVPLPPDLPLGRVTVDLVLEGTADTTSPPVVAAARLLPSAAAGEVRWEGDLVVQSAASLLDHVRRIPGGAELTGVFVPPSGGGSDRQFQLVVEGPGGEPIAEVVFRGGWWARLSGRRSFALPLGEEPGLRRFRFVATGAPGPPARWEGLRFHSPDAEDAEEAPEPEPRPPAAPPHLVVVYVMDALRADHVGHLGGPADASPTLDRLAAEGATFLRHQSVAPNTLPSTKSLFIGRAFVDRGGSKLPASGPPPLAELFRRAGYRTGLFSGNVHVGPAYGTDRGFEHVAPDLDVEDGEEPYNDNAARVHAAALAWLRDLEPGQKAFAYLHTIHPHNPYDPPAEIAARATAGIPSEIDGSTRTLLDLKHRRRHADEADRRRLSSLYAGSFAYNDAELGRFLEELGRLVPPEETLLAVTSDHGEELFDHGGVLHGYTLYEEMLRIPLILQAPGRIGSVRVDLPSDTLDLHATLLELCGLDAAAASEGRSLAALATGREGGARSRAEPRRAQLAAASSLRGGIFSARTADWKVVWAPRTGRRWGMGEGLGRSRDAEYLFHLATDPGERVNRAGEGDLEAQWLRSLLLAWVERGLEGDGQGDDSRPDPATLRRLRALGYAD